MEYIYAEELKSVFDVSGHFYRLEIGDDVFDCRSVLDIREKGMGVAAVAAPSAVVVMMNPGSSRPADVNYVPAHFTVDKVVSGSWEKEVVATRPDNAQYQIMRLMLLKDWGHVRVINLSDLCNGNSWSFSHDFSKAKGLDSSCPHSLTHPGRQKELQNLCLGAPMVIAAWGSNPVLRDVAEAFISVGTPLRGLALDYPYYRYPSPYRKDQKLKWLQLMLEELES